jgi:hypothetical protein
MDKNQVMIAFLQNCQTISDNPLFFNFGNIEDNANQAITASDDVALQKPYVDGSVLKRFTFHIDSFKTIAYNPVIQGHNDNNLEGFKEVQALIDWINTQGDNNIFPDFGTDCIIETMQTTTNKPELISVESGMSPPVAIYRVSIRIEYVDFSKCLWK